MTDSHANWWPSVERALAVGEKVVRTADEFNKACEHIVRLLQDSSLLLEAESPATATFLAITALEEVAKVHIGMFRHSATIVQRRNDPLFQHEEKHRLAAAPSVTMGSRLQQVIGETRMHDLIELARSGGLVRLRESALYAEQKDKGLQVPMGTISPSTARDVLLFAIECFDDALVGYTNHSFVLGNATDELFSRWEPPQQCNEADGL